jgi:large subunit ribosomal protein L4
VEKLDFDKPSTKDFVSMLGALGIEAKKSLIVLGDVNKSVYLSSRNFKGSSVITASELNTYSLMNAQNVVLAEDALEKLETVLRK